MISRSIESPLCGSWIGKRTEVRGEDLPVTAVHSHSTVVGSISIRWSAA